MAALGESTPARRGVCVPRALLTQPPENVNVGAQALSYLLAFLYFTTAGALPSLSFIFIVLSDRARLGKSNLRMTPSADYLSP